MTLLGGLAVETFMIYPNIFADPPASTELAARFFAVNSPKLSFRPMGLVCWITGAAGLVLAWRARAVRWWLVGSGAAIGADGVWSQLFAWPRNTVMFEGLPHRPAAVIIQTAHELQDLHWPRWPSTWPPPSSRSPDSCACTASTAVRRSRPLRRPARCRGDRARRPGPPVAARGSAVLFHVGTGLRPRTRARWRHQPAAGRVA
jgi:hypothetical protein